MTGVSITAATLSSVGIFRRGRQPQHSASVIYVYDRRKRMAYYSAVCTCGWYAEPVDATYPDPSCEQQMAAAALAHDPAADVKVSFPIDEPKAGR